MRTLNKNKQRVFLITFPNSQVQNLIMTSLFFFFVLSVQGCSVRDGYYYNHCGGVQIPICEYKVEEPIASEEEKKFKQKMLESMTLMVDIMMQNLLQSMK